MREVILPVVVVLAVAVVAVPATAGAAPVEKAATVCDLLEPSEIEEVVGRRAGTGEETEPDVCEWMMNRRNGSRIVALLLRASETRVRRAFANGKERFAPVAVRGLGSDAFYADGLDTVWVVKNKRTLFFVQGLAGAAGIPRAQLLELARIALPRA